MRRRTHSQARSVARTGVVLALIAAGACTKHAAEEVVSETVVPVMAAPVVTGPIRGRVHATGVVSPSPGGELVVIAPDAPRAALPVALVAGLERDAERCHPEQHALALILYPEATP